ncbi:signal peptide peptidase-domain-containing protein [Phellopilus nigrolimitatus]|nr:signal peptide peptidase-domain-containing protein [Phellopilus nigrolimitatus]
MTMAGQDWNLLSSYAGLLGLATLSVYTGSFGSLKAPRKPKGSTTEDDSDDDEDIPDRISATDAYLFPILGSVMLLGLYLVVKFLGVEWINWLLGWYFTIAGVGSVWKCSVSVTKTMLGPDCWKSYNKWKLLLLNGSSEFISFSLRTPSLALFIPSTLPSILYTFFPGPKKSALLTDILALSFSHNALSIMKLDTFKTGIILLSGLFLYDIWWVFGTEVMVKVATSLDVPIKILWPKSYIFSTQKGFTMLGLGDIVIPGMFVSTALRFDFNKSAHKNPKQAFAKPYFTAAVSAYGLGLATTMVVMHTFGAAQPALLYLSPSCILSFLITALAKGELKEAWAWTDEAEPAESESMSKKLGEPHGSPGTSDFDDPSAGENRNAQDATKGVDAAEVAKRERKNKTVI